MKDWLKHRSDYILPIIVALFGLIFLIHGLGWAYPKPTGYINDFAGIIPDSDEQKLLTHVLSMKDQYGVEITIVTVVSLEGQDAESYARGLGNSWGVGKKSGDTGLILLIAPNEKKWFFKTGYGMEAMLPDSRLGSIGRNIFVPLYRQKRITDAFVQTLVEIEKDVKQYQAKETKVQITDPVNEKSNFPVEIFIFGSIALIALLGTWGIISLIRNRREEEVSEEKNYIESSTVGVPFYPIIASTITYARPSTSTPDRETRSKKEDNDDSSSRKSSSSDDDDHHHSSSSWDSGSSWNGGGFGGGSFGGGGGGGDL